MDNEEKKGFVAWLSQQSLPIRILGFSLGILAVLLLIFGLTFLLYYLNVSNYPRIQPISLDETVTVAELMQFTDEEAYPAAVTTSVDGSLYTGSYLTGAVWLIAPDGSYNEIPQTREQIGAVIGLEAGNDGALYILDAIAPLNQGGGKIWRSSSTGLDLLYDIPANGDISIQQPNDIALDALGHLYVADIMGGRVLRLEGETLSIWWQGATSQYRPAGLAYDALNNRLLITDAIRPEIYAIPIDATDPEAERVTVFSAGETEDFIGFNGITVDSAGSIYVAALAQNQIWRIDTLTGDSTILAGYYRGSSDVAYASPQNRLIVNNWDQSWLAPLNYFGIEFTVAPRLPFSVDVINLGE